MANFAYRSFTTLGYVSAVLLIAIVSVLALTSFGDDSNGQPALGIATPAPTQVSLGAGEDVSSIAAGIDATTVSRDSCFGAGRHVVGFGHPAEIETPDCPSAFD
jgi:hypothetical protein